MTLFITSFYLKINHVGMLVDNKILLMVIYRERKTSAHYAQRWERK